MHDLMPAEVDPLTPYALDGLALCWLPDRGRWSHKYHLDGRPAPNESVPHSDVYYSLNVLLGLSRVQGVPHDQTHDLPDAYRRLCQEALTLPVRRGAWGMALWAGAALGLAPPGAVCDRLRALIGDGAGVRAWTAQDAGLSLTGLCALAAHDASWRPAATALSRVLLDHFRGPAALFRDSGAGPRRHVATFATQVYAAMALYHYGALTGDAPAIEAAHACTARLIALQGPQGEWPWFYAPATGRVLDLYEVYSVHQHGMGPALLQCAAEAGLPGAAAAMQKGLAWLFGGNAMGTAMFVPGLPLVYRSQARRGLAARRGVRLVRGIVQELTGAAPAPVPASALRLTPEMRSYEFGWLLWSFGGNAGRGSAGTAQPALAWPKSPVPARST